MRHPVPVIATDQGSDHIGAFIARPPGDSNGPLVVDADGNVIGNAESPKE
jgi:hypothetical protein